MKSQNQILSIVSAFFVAILFSNTMQAQPAQNVHIVDMHLKGKLLANSAININKDAEIQKSEALNFTGVLNLSSLGIVNITGLEYFENITGLNISNNQLSSLTLANHHNLKFLDCHKNILSSIDLSGCSSLEVLECNVNALATLNLSANIKLQHLICSNNQLINLDLTDNLLLRYLECSNNQLKSLDISDNEDVYALYCNTNQLTSLNVANQNNAMMSGSGFNALNNSGLTCVEVDDVDHSVAKWPSSVDPGVAYSINCTSVNPLNSFDNTNIKQTLFAGPGQPINRVSNGNSDAPNGIDNETQALRLQVFPNPTADQVTVDLGEEMKNVTIEVFNAAGESVMTKSYPSLSQTSMNLEGAAGVYWLSVIVGNEQKATLSLIKK